jgi:hypothetical protein
MKALSICLISLSMTGGLGVAVSREGLAQKRQRDLITREELQNSAQKNQDLFAAIRSLRPHFLAGPRGIRTLGGAPANPTVLYVDGNRIGELDRLREIQTADVDEVRYLDPTKAEEEYGITHNGGAVLVRMYRASKPAKPEPLLRP